MKPKIIGLAVVVALLASGAVVARQFFAPKNDRAIRLVPSHASVYMSVFLNPSVSQKRNIEALLGRFERAPSTDDARDALVGLLDEALADQNMTYEGDVEPWLGDQIALFFAGGAAGEPAAAGLVATEDAGAARRFFERILENEDVQRTGKGSHRGQDYAIYDGGVTMGAVEGFWVVGTPAGFESAVDAARGRSLEDGDAYRSAVSGLEEDPIATQYVDYERLPEDLGAFAALDPGGDLSEPDLLDLDAFEGMGFAGTAATSFHVARDSIVIETVASADAGFFSGNWVRATGLLEGLPSSAWMALSFSGVGDTVIDLVDWIEQTAPGTTPGVEEDFMAMTGFDLRSEVLSWMGDVAFFTEGESLLGLGGAAVVTSEDEALSTRTMEDLGVRLATEGLLVQPTEVAGMEGYSVSLPGAPQPLYVLYGEKVIVAYGMGSADGAVAAEETLGEDSEAYRRAGDALGDGFDGVFFLDLERVFGLAEAFGAGSDPTYRDDVKPWVDPLTHIVLGSRLDGDRVHQKLVIGVE